MTTKKDKETVEEEEAEQEGQKGNEIGDTKGRGKTGKGRTKTWTRKGRT